MLAVGGAALDADDRRCSRAFAAQLALAVERRRLRAEAAARPTARARRTSCAPRCCAAVSHDLRTPLAAIKASATSLLQPDVELGTPSAQEFLEAIDEETDRLDTLVGNLLDMSRLQAGALELRAGARSASTRSCRRRCASLGDRRGAV